MNARCMLRVSVALLFLCAVSAPAVASNIITNGDFGTGDLTGWTAFTTSNGTNGQGLPDVVMFNTTGMGDTNSAHFDVGEVNFTGEQEGGGLMQTVMAPSSGLYSYSMYFASQDDADGEVNAAAGLFSIIINGTTVASDDLGGFSSSYQILYGSLNGSVDLSAGMNTFEFLITRPYLSSGSSTPDQYVTDISLSSTTSTPEPATMLLLGTGLLGLALVWRKRMAA